MMKCILVQPQHFVLGNKVSALTSPVFEFPGQCKPKHNINALVHRENALKMEAISSVHAFELQYVGFS